jgi:hypothetical protein
MITLSEYLEAEYRLDVKEYGHGWRVHAAVYATVMTALIVLNLVLVATTDQDFLWFFFPLVCWGIGLAIHYYFAVHQASREIRDHQEKVQRLAEERLGV